MCGVCGIISLKCTENCIEKMLETSVETLKHRGYDGFGIVTSNFDECNEGFNRRRTSLHSSKLMNNSNNDVSNHQDTIIKEKYAKELSPFVEVDKGVYPFESSDRWMGLAHTRYRTQGNFSIENGQPIWNNNCDIALVHNGQVKCDINESNSDTRHILNVFEREYQLSENIEKSVKRVFDSVDGSYGCILMIKNKGMVAFRDPRGIRPLIVGVQNTNVYSDNVDSMIGQLEFTLLSTSIKQKQLPPRADRVVFASESIVLETLGCHVIRDVNPGEVVWVQKNGAIITYQYSPTIRTPCMFEYIYLADKRSVIDGINVNHARKTMGALVANQILASNLSPDLVVPIPSTPNSAAQMIAKYLKAIYSELIYIPCISNTNDRNTSRTFILPTQASREDAVKRKFSINGEELLRLYKTHNWKTLQHTHIALVDDSIVRGTTMKRIVELVRSHLQPREITLVSLAPPIMFENYYGIDIPDRNTLIAHSNTTEQIAKILGVNRVIYGDNEMIKDYLSKIAFKNGVLLNGFEDSVFTSHHTTLCDFSIKFEDNSSDKSRDKSSDTKDSRNKSRNKSRDKSRDKSSERELSAKIEYNSRKGEVSDKIKSQSNIPVIPDSLFR